ncbi:MAG: APC family permease [Verrucomicrobiota bacterium]|nr:APC family permease [Verrucomicrobiota bacterium]
MPDTKLGQRIKDIVIGRSRDLGDSGLFHKLSLVTMLAWVGLGADGLSSSCYGPEECFKALSSHPSLVLIVGALSAVTVLVLCASYSQIISLFPSGGGGYVVASKLLSPKAGVVSGCALLIDYVLTISISIASGSDALFSFLPPEYAGWKLATAAAGVGILTLLNLRGVRESVAICVPIFAVFLATHAFAIIYALVTHAGQLPGLVGETASAWQGAQSEIGFMGVMLLILRSYSMGAGTYTGIEAVSNGLPILREPRVRTGRRTMTLMGISLALTGTGLLIAYLLYQVTPQAGKTLNAVLFDNLTLSWGAPWGTTFVIVTLASEAALLFIAAQAGFLDGPRVLSNMALDRWLPTRFAALSDRFVTMNGVILMGGAALVILLLTRGSVGLLVILYSINVFITFTLSQLGMVRHWWQCRKTEPAWVRKLAINGTGLAMTSFILVTLTLEKFTEGGFITILVTALAVAGAIFIRRHYDYTGQQLKSLNTIVEAAEVMPAFDWTGANHAKGLRARTAVFFVNGFNGLGLHTLFSAMRLAGGPFKRYIFINVGVLDAGNFKGAEEVQKLRAYVDGESARYINWVQKRGGEAISLTALGHDVVVEADKLAAEAAERYPDVVFFGGQLLFNRETVFTRFLHNYTVFALQRRLFLRRQLFLIMPVCVETK